MGKSVPSYKPIPIVVETPDQKKIRELEEELKKMTEEACDRIESMVKSETSKAKEVIEELRSKNYNLNERITELERQVNNFTQQVNNLREENQILRSQISPSIVKVNSLTQTEIKTFQHQNFQTEPLKTRNQEVQTEKLVQNKEVQTINEAQEQEVQTEISSQSLKKEQREKELKELG